MNPIRIRRTGTGTSFTTGRGSSILSRPATSPAPTGSRYQNRPPSFTSTLTDYGFSDSIPASNDAEIGSDWWVNWNASGYCSRVEDATAPMSPNYVAQWHYPTGMSSGGGVGNLARTFSSTNQIYFALDLKWDSDYQFHSVSTKLLYLEPTNTILQMMWGNEMMIHRGSGEGYPEEDRYPFTQLGEWVHLEFVADAVNDFFSVWLNNNLVMHWEPSDGVTGGWTETSINSTWGGAGDTKNRDSYRWIDHVLIARP